MPPSTASYYSIEPLPLRLLATETNIKVPCALAVCLAKNNPLLCGNDGKHIVQQMLTELSSRHSVVYILIADAINVYERMISNGTTINQAKRLADNEGERIAKLYKEYAQEFHLENIEIIRWAELETDTYKQHIDNFTKLVQENEQIKSRLMETAVFYIRRRNPTVTITPARTKLFEQYLLNEMVIQLFGFTRHQQQCQIIYHAVFVPSLEETASYISPVLDLKQEFKHTYKDSDTFTSRIFVQK